MFVEGRSYNNIFLRYDIYSDQLIYNHIHQSGNHALMLNKIRIDSFIIEKHKFRQIFSDTGESQFCDPGFYEVIVAGRVSFYQKWIKRYTGPTQNSPGEFVLFNELYVLNKEQSHKISRKSGLIKALKDKEKEIKTYIKKYKIFIGNGDVESIKRVVDYYNTLHQ